MLERAMISKNGDTARIISNTYGRILYNVFPHKQNKQFIASEQQF
jgi:hypothetical protein